jgi:hypothetical protein
VSDKELNRYSVKRAGKKLPKPVSTPLFPENPTAGGSLEPIAA